MDLKKIIKREKKEEIKERPTVEIPKEEEIYSEEDLNIKDSSKKVMADKEDKEEKEEVVSELTNEEIRQTLIVHQDAINRILYHLRI